MRFSISSFFCLYSSSKAVRVSVIFTISASASSHAFASVSASKAAFCASILASLAAFAISVSPGTSAFSSGTACSAASPFTSSALCPFKKSSSTFSGTSLCSSRKDNDIESQSFPHFTQNFALASKICPQ